MDVILPRIDPEMTEGTIVKWYKKTGECVKKGEALFVLETGKVTVDIEAPESGKLTIIMDAGTTASVGTVIARIDPDPGCV